jgi:hypothetical protein
MAGEILGASIELVLYFVFFHKNGGRNSRRINRTCSVFCFSSEKMAGEILGASIELVLYFVFLP